MNQTELIEHAKRLAREMDAQVANYNGFVALSAQVLEFLKKVAGQGSAFLELAESAAQLGIPEGPIRASKALMSFVQYVEAGLADEVSLVRRAQLDVVSDFLDQAQSLLNDTEVHPAAPTVLIGATLEEFLRTWLEQNDLAIGQRKPGMEAYSQALRESDLITKQDAKDITAWAGLRNHAAHGEWDQVNRDAALLMLQGINLFMRKYESGKARN